MENNKNIFEHGYALFIGIRYGHWSANLSPLDGTLRDISSLKSHFTHPEKAAYKSENVISLTEEAATAKGIINALDQLNQMAKKDAEATVIIYYSGHGETDGKNYFLVPYDFELEKWQDELKGGLKK